MTRLEELSTCDAITVSVDAPIDDAIRLLHEHKIRHLPVVRGTVPVGFVSAGDVLATVGGLLAEQRASTNDATVPYAGPTAVEEIMTPSIVAVSPEESPATAARLMLEKKIAAVVLMADETIVGIVTETDYLRRFVDESTVVSDTCRQQLVADHMTTEIVTATPSENVFSVIRDMAQRFHHLPVVEDGKLVGVLSDHDVRRAMALDKIEQITGYEQRIRLMENFDAGRIMSKDVKTTTPTATLAEAAAQMVNNKVGALPVMDLDALVGIITETDILQAYADMQGGDSS